jgi:hypothetical protein
MTGDSELPFWRDERPKPANVGTCLWRSSYLVTPGYLPAMGIPLRRGRS